MQQVASAWTDTRCKVSISLSSGKCFWEFLNECSNDVTGDFCIISNANNNRKAYPCPSNHTCVKKATFHGILMIFRVYNHKPKRWQWNFLLSTPSYAFVGSGTRGKVKKGDWNQEGVEKWMWRNYCHTFSNPFGGAGEHQAAMPAESTDQSLLSQEDCCGRLQQVLHQADGTYQAETILTYMLQHLFLMTSLLSQFWFWLGVFPNLTGLNAIQYEESKSMEYLVRKQLGSQAKILAITFGKWTRDDNKHYFLESVFVCLFFNKQKESLEFGPAGTHPKN